MWRPSQRVGWAMAVAIALLLFAVHLPATRGAMLYDDAADYMRAAELPVAQTWWNTNSASPLSLLQLRHTSEDFAAHPWDFLYSTGDAMALRHFHAPVSYYGMAAVYLLGGGARAERMLTAAVAATSCGVLFLVLLRASVPAVVAAALAFFAGMQSRFFEATIDPSPHAWYMLCAMLCLGWCAAYVEQGRRNDLYRSVAALAVACATLEFTVLLPATFAICCVLLWWLRRGPAWAATRSRVLPAVALFCGITVVLWPGGWLRGGYAMSYGLLVTQMLFHHASAFAVGEPLSAGLVYRLVLGYDVLLPWVFLLWLACAVVLLLRGRLSSAGILLSVYAACAFALGVAAHFRLNTYVSEFVFFLIAAVGVVGTDAARALRLAVPRLRGVPASVVHGVIAILLLAASAAERRQWNDVWGPNPDLLPVVASLQRHVPQRATILASKNREALALYLPQFHFEGTLPDSAVPFSASRNAGTHYFLLDSTMPAPDHASMLDRFEEPHSRQMVLWQTP